MLSQGCFFRLPWNKYRSREFIFSTHLFQTSRLAPSLRWGYISNTLSRINFSLMLSSGSFSTLPVEDLPVQLRPANSPMLNSSKTAYLLKTGASEQRLLSFIALRVSIL